MRFNSQLLELLTDLGRVVSRVQVKTWTVFRNGCREVTVCTRGGNRSWNGVVKHLDPSRYDYLFVFVGYGRRWYIPAAKVGGGCGILLGGPKYAESEIDPGPVGLRAAVQTASA